MITKADSQGHCNYQQTFWALDRTDKKKKSTVDQTLNTMNPSIQFTMEQETDNQLPFLEVLLIMLMREDDRKVKTTVYGDETHTDRCLPFTSHHQAQVKTKYCDNLDETS